MKYFVIMMAIMTTGGKKGAGMIFVGLIDSGFDDAILDSVVTFNVEFPLVVENNDGEMTEIPNMRGLELWADEEFTEWEVR